MAASQTNAQVPIREVIDENNKEPFRVSNRVWHPMNAIATPSGGKGRVSNLYDRGIGVIPDCEIILDDLIKRLNQLIDRQNAEAQEFFDKHPRRINIPRRMQFRHHLNMDAAVKPIDNYKPFNNSGPTLPGASACMTRQEIVFRSGQLRHLKLEQ